MLTVNGENPESTPWSQQQSKCDYRCHHNTRQTNERTNSKPSSKNTACPFRMHASIRRTDVQSKKSVKDVHHFSNPSSLVIVFAHNHPIDAMEVLRRRDIGIDVQTKFQKLFESGYSPRSALEVHKYDLQLEHGDDYVEKAADRRYCPDMQWCFRKYYQIFKADGKNNFSDECLIDTLQQRVVKFNEELGDNTIACRVLDDGSMVISICSPLMRRTHRVVNEAANLVFVDSTGNPKNGNCYVYMFMVNCEAGGLPLGLVISTSDCEASLTNGFDLLKMLFPEDAFCGRAEQGPLHFMTDDCSAVRNALATVFPESLGLLCQSHVLWDAWRWLWSESSPVEVCFRSILYQLIEDAVTADTYEALAEAFTKVHYHEAANQYGEFIGYVDQLLEKSTLWSSCYRQDDLNTSHTVDIAVRIIKDKLFKRQKAFNLVHLVDFVMTKMEQYYVQRLVNIINGDPEKSLRLSRVFPKDQRIVMENVWKILPDVVSVPCESATHHVNLSACICSCVEGYNGAPCSHQWAAFNKYRTDFKPPGGNSALTSSSLSKQLFYISSGVQDIPPEELFHEFETRPSSSLLIGDEPENSVLINIDSLVDDKLDLAERNLQVFAASLADKMRRFPTVYLPAIESFLAGYERVSSMTNADVLLALHSFGKYSRSIRPVQAAGQKRKASSVDFS